MRYLVLGAGLYGRSLARRLMELGSEVVVVDRDEETIDDMKELVTNAVIADITDRQVLEEIVDRFKPDSAAVCFGESFDVTMLACIYLRELGIKEIVARASSVMQGEILRRLGIDWIVLPEQDSGERIAEYIILGESEQIKLDPETSLARLRLPKSVVGKTLSELPFKKFGIECLFVHRVYVTPHVSKLIPPSEDPQLEEGDNLIVVGSPRRIARFIDGIKKS